MRQFHTDFQLRKYSRTTVDAYTVRDVGNAFGRLQALFPRHVAIAPWVSGGGKQHFFVVFETREEASAPAAQGDNEWQIIIVDRHQRNKPEIVLLSVMQKNGGWLCNPSFDIPLTGARDASMEGVLDTIQGWGIYA
ncbi:hypothetical protein M407DRAFT_154781 [Tulasnella calospora MUT 4182]|uniref:Uncharacterized protein n=1 Tax=Tulasnella calospora MUT 4182 TaxID=1051891 RepID=A0A0C3PV93_9AGAM|nr:hypothetical protein M407DRAFT_154781 [Tulasnella calospora MUT 4182]